MEIKIKVDLSPVSARPPLRALADVTLNWPGGELTIHRCAVFEKSGEPAWATLPKLQIDRNGKRIYVPLIDMPRDLKRRVSDAILAAYPTRCKACQFEFPWCLGPTERAMSEGPDNP